MLVCKADARNCATNFRYAEDPDEDDILVSVTLEESDADIACHLLEEIFAQKEHRFLPECGWLSPEGIFFRTGFGAHEQYAEYIFGRDEHELELEGWAKVTVSYGSRVVLKATAAGAGYGPITFDYTEEQAKWLLENEPKED